MIEEKGERVEILSQKKGEGRQIGGKGLEDNEDENKVVRCLYKEVFCFCVVQKKEGVETKVVMRLITERAGRTKSVSYLCFPHISGKR